MIYVPQTNEELAVAAELERIRRTNLVGSHVDMSQYQRDPIGYCVDILGDREETIIWSKNPGYESHVWDGDEDPFAKAFDAVVEGMDVGMESGTGTGKTWWLSRLQAWFISCWVDSIVITAAPKQDQLLLNVWKEFGRIWPPFSKTFPKAALTSGKLRIRGGTDESWAATAFVCGVGADEDSATKAQGFHAVDMLHITEETPGIHRAIMNAFENTRTDVHNLQVSVGNPDHQQDELHRFCLKPSTVHIRISALDHPNVVSGKPIIPGAISQKRIDERRLEYGETGRLYLSRVRGISPSESAESLIKGRWFDEAVERYHDPAFREGDKALGVDVANSEAGDKAAVARGRGACLIEVESKPCPDSNVLGSEVADEMEAEGILEGHVGVDPVGVGAGTVNEAKRRGWNVRALNGGHKPGSEFDHELFADMELTIRFAEEFGNLRAQMWWRLREDLRRGYVAMPNDPELKRDLTTPEWYTRNGKIFVEAKEEVVKRLGRSPDKGDAAVYWNWVRPRGPKPEEPVDLPVTNYDTRYYDVIERAMGKKKARPF